MHMEQHLQVNVRGSSGCFLFLVFLADGFGSEEGALSFPLRFCLPQPYTLHQDMRRCVSHSTDSTDESMIAVQTTLQTLLEQRYSGRVGGPMTRHRQRINKRLVWGRWEGSNGHVGWGEE